MKTVLAPNAPWPKQEMKSEPKSRKRQSPWRNPPPKLNLVGDLDYFAEAREEINKSKTAIKSRVRDVTTGRFKGSNRLSG
jgi:hypothetical protein